MECLPLHVQDIDFSRNEILVRDGKGAKDRITMLPESLKKPLGDHLKQVKSIHEKDLADGWGRVQLPNALDRKYPNAPLPNGDGSGCFLKSTDGRTQKPAKKDGITWMSH